MNRIILAAVLCLLGSAVQARNTGCSIGTVETGCSSDAATALHAALTDYIAAYGDPGTWDNGTTVYEHDDSIAVCGMAGSTRFVWAWSQETDRHLGVGKDAKKVWGRLCR